MINTIKKISILVTALFSVIFLTSASFAADATVEMLNKQGKESMVFSQKIVKIKPKSAQNLVIFNKQQSTNNKQQ